MWSFPQDLKILNPYCHVPQLRKPLGIQDEVHNFQLGFSLQVREQEKNWLEYTDMPSTLHSPAQMQNLWKDCRITIFTFFVCWFSEQFFCLQFLSDFSDIYIFHLILFAFYLNVFMTCLKGRYFYSYMKYV